jgi:HAE1 family hydrophobic/amphiphilic exporter-1
MSGLFESVQRAVALMIALPFALSGAIWTLFLAGVDFDQAAAVGVLLLIGIVVNNGIVMIEHINEYQRAGMSRTRAMLRGGRERLRPILMTAMTTLLGLVPIVVQQPSLGGMSYSSMALVVIGGLSVSSFLTTVLLPTTATLVEDSFWMAGRLWGRMAQREAGACRVQQGDSSR